MSLKIREMGDLPSPDLRALLSAVPEDPRTAFVLADCLEEQNDAPLALQGELLRLVYTLTRAIGGDHRPELEARMQQLLAQGVRPIGPYRRLELDDQVAMEFAWVPPGVFLMGSPTDEEGRITEQEYKAEFARLGGFSVFQGSWDEGPQHPVTLTRGFWMGTTPVTQAQYELLKGHNPSWDSTVTWDADGQAWVDEDSCDKPVQEVSWHDAMGFLRRLANRAGGGRRFRLPTEAEWEYACRAGTTTRFWSGNSEADLARVAWYRESEGDLHPVGKAPNPLGLCDVHGSVWEWCADRFDEHYYARSPSVNPRCTRGEDDQRVIRGGGAWNHARDCRSASRNSNGASYSHNDIGFRVVADRL